MIVFLQDAADTPLSQIGGKAKALAWAIRQGWPVPLGFVLSVDGTGDVVAAVAKLNAQRVAVRSSATEEDGEHHSFAGQFDTVLNVKPDEVEAAIAKVRASASSERVQVYRNTDKPVPIAVIVQAMIPATHAGVMFTTDPDDLNESHVVIEASAGLGEQVVSGSVTPDRYRLKKTEPVQSQPGCLSDSQLSQLVELATKVESACGAPQDVEFAFDHDHLWLLQHRPITTVTANEREAIRNEIITHLKSRVHLGPLVRENLAESLDAPTPMTWAVVRPMFTRTGAIGRMNRGFGGTPDESLSDEAAYELVAGRVMHRPQIGMRLLDKNAVALSTPGAGLWKVLRGMWFAHHYTKKVNKAARTFPSQFLTLHLALYLRSISLTDLSILDNEALLSRFESVRKATDLFAEQAFQPAVFAQQVQQTLSQPVNDTQAWAIPIPAECSLTDGFEELATGTMREDEFLQQFGHRSHNELELSQPRWNETGAPIGTVRKKQSEPAPPNAEKYVQFLALRETAKHHLIRGFAELRQILLQFDRRFDLRNGIFYLMPEELPQLVAGDNLLSLIRTRQRRRRAELSLELPHRLDQDFEAIGRQVPPLNGSTLQGTGVSAGVAEGVVLKLTEPTTHVLNGPTILVCPSTDPAWLPLLMQCSGATMETGGTLSHGAIVCRELGAPAVAGVPGLMQLLKTGDRVRIDGRLGTIELLTEPTR
jgi:rifampicin phosphotransferase